MPLDITTKQIILEQIADYIDWFPTESVSDIPLLVRALEAYLEGNNEKVPQKMRDSLDIIISYVNSPDMRFVPRDSVGRNEVIVVVNELISRRIAVLNAMSEEDKVAYVREYNTRIERGRLLYLIARKLVEQVRRRPTGEDPATLGRRVLAETRREIDHLFTFIASRERDYLYSYADTYPNIDYKLFFMRNIDFLVEEGYSFEDIKRFMIERKLFHPYVEDYRTAAKELGVTASELLDLGRPLIAFHFHKYILCKPKEIKKITEHCRISVAELVRCGRESIRALTTNPDACIAFMDKHNLTFEAFSRLYFDTAAQIPAAESLMEKLGLSLLDIEKLSNNVYDRNRLKSALKHPDKIKMLKQAANLSSHEVMHLDCMILENPDPAMLILRELGGAALEKINNFKNFPLIEAILIKSDLVIDLVKNHHVTLDMLDKIEPGFCIYLLRGHYEFRDMSTEQRANLIRENINVLNDGDPLLDRKIIKEIDRIVNSRDFFKYSPDFKWETQKQGFFSAQETPDGVIKVREILKSRESASKQIEAINILMQKKTDHPAPSRSHGTIALYNFLKKLTSTNDNQSKKDKIGEARSKFFCEGTIKSVVELHHDIGIHYH